MIEIPSETELRRRAGRKWRSYPDDVIPAWIADMDLMPAPAIVETLSEALRLGDFGYGLTMATNGVPAAFARWAERRWDWRVRPEDVLLMPDVVGGIANCIEALSAPGDAIIVQTPAYPPLLGSVRTAGRRLMEHELADGHIDLDELDALMSRENVRMMLFCHPHNPSGHCFTALELTGIAELARKHDVVVISDEVHADLTYRPHRHIPFATIAPERTVTLNAPSKAFNVAGLRTAVCVARGDLLAKLKSLPSTRWNAFSAPGVRAALAAWSDAGEGWLIACVDHLQARRDQLAMLLAAHCPAIGYVPPEAGYLAWLDCRALGIEDPAGYFLERAKVALSAGPDFGAPGAGHVRLNFATSAVILEEIVGRMGRALSPLPLAGGVGGGPVSLSATPKQALP
ncbi:MAG: MalY/PatB family protein [Sphingobium sp.]